MNRRLLGRGVRSTPIAAPDDHSELVISPSPAQSRRNFKSAVGILFGLLAVAALRFGFGIAFRLIALTFALVLGGSYLYLRKARVFVTPSEIGVVGILGRRTHSRSDISTIVTVPITTHVYRGTSNVALPAVRTWFILDRAGRTIVRLNERAWSDDDMARLVKALGIRSRVLDGPMTAKELSETYPNAVNWLEGNAKAVGVVVGVLLMVGVVILALRT